MGSAMAPPSITYPVSHLRQFSEGPDGPVEAGRSGVDQLVDGVAADFKLVDARGHVGLVGRVVEQIGRDLEGQALLTHGRGRKTRDQRRHRDVHPVGEFAELPAQVFIAAVAEAERGYDLDVRKAHERKLGRPLSVGPHAAISITTRLAPGRISALDAFVAKHGTTRSQ